MYEVHKRLVEWNECLLAISYGLGEREEMRRELGNEPQRKKQLVSKWRTNSVNVTRGAVLFFLLYWKNCTKTIRKWQKIVKVLFLRCLANRNGAWAKWIQGFSRWGARLKSGCRTNYSTLPCTTCSRSKQIYCATWISPPTSSEEWNWHWKFVQTLECSTK